jgi:hypothetical protein
MARKPTFSNFIQNALQPDYSQGEAAKMMQALGGTRLRMGTGSKAKKFRSTKEAVVLKNFQFNMLPQLKGKLITLLDVCKYIQCVPLAGRPGKCWFTKRTKVQYICMSYL